ncbi:hypothetical protein ACFV6D_06275 [Kitasatospora sp. NPDC059812]|uniref:hypothetical protein n=1 Tax=Kitasatospora sp. NPDC059812 TaxID=3346958 RepID=UPI00364E38BC
MSQLSSRTVINFPFAPTTFERAHALLEGVLSLMTFAEAPPMTYLEGPPAAGQSFVTAVRAGEFGAAL